MAGLEGQFRPSGTAALSAVRRLVAKTNNADSISCGPDTSGAPGRDSHVRRPRIHRRRSRPNQRRTPRPPCSTGRRRCWWPRSPSLGDRSVSCARARVPLARRAVVALRTRAYSGALVIAYAGLDPSTVCRCARPYRGASGRSVPDCASTRCASRGVVEHAGSMSGRRAETIDEHRRD